MLLKRYGKIEAGKTGLVNLDEAAIIQLGKAVVEEKYGNLFEMYEKNYRRKTHMKCRCVFYPAVHYTMGGLWVDYELQNNCSWLICIRGSKFQ
jgi:succinate dehydrogenase / fumarate reductase flavoprotein subunit